MKRYYSPRLDRDLITALYHEAKARGIPMTKLASRLLREARLANAVSRQNRAVSRHAPPDRGQKR